MIGASFVVRLDGIAADVLSPAMVSEPVGAVAGEVIRGPALLRDAGRKA
jgi:hypothetical protein